MDSHVNIGKFLDTATNEQKKKLISQLEELKDDSLTEFLNKLKLLVR